MAATKATTSAAGAARTLTEAAPVPGATPATPADLTPADVVHPSGALVEPEVLTEINVTHPAVDNAPRAGLPAEASRIDFNDPRSAADIRAADTAERAKAQDPGDAA